MQNTFEIVIYESLNPQRPKQIKLLAETRRG